MHYPLLEKIHSPIDLKSLNLAELITLSKEIRQRIIDVLAVNGGHLASNLGSVEFTLALHTVFSSPEDKFIFDVSHQSYTHKLVTGRNPLFDKVRKYKGLCGFCHPHESPHDQFHAGHAGTALSLGLGMAKARDLLDESYHVIPIIGDATLTCGLSLEALNNITRKLKRFIVILNDNAMSISHNVGGITNILSRLINNPTTSKWAFDFEEMLSKIPGCGSKIAKQGLKFAESVKNLVSPAPFFEQFGLSYIGPIDGHDLKKLIPLFETLKDCSMPVIIHLYTKKGHGLDKAEKDPISYHGAKPFDPCTCEFLPATSTKPTFPKIFGSQLLKMAQEDPSLIAVTPAMSHGSCLDPMMKAYPDRCIDVGIAEGHAVTFCGGLAKGGLKVICSIYATFLQRALDNLFHDVCLQELPVVFTIDRGGISGPDGATHHGIYEIGFLKTMPNIVICQPRNGRLLRELMESAFSWNRPTAIRYPNLSTDDYEGKLTYRPIGKGEVLQEGGDDLLIIALGHQCQTALHIAEKLSRLGICATVVDPIFLKPLDADLLGKLLLSHQKIVTIEEHSLKGGLGNELNNFFITFGFSSVSVLNFGIPEAFLDQGDYQDLLNEIGLTPDKMVRQIVTHFSFPMTEKMNI